MVAGIKKAVSNERNDLFKYSIRLMLGLEKSHKQEPMGIHI